MTGGMGKLFRHSFAAPMPTPVTVDLDKYRRHLDHLDMPEERKHELLQSLWVMMKSFVDRAFGEDSTQLIRSGGSHGAKDEMAESSMVASLPDDLFNNPNNLSHAFRHHAVKSEDRRTR